MHIPIEIVAGLIVVWIGLQLSMLRSIAKLETQQAVNKEKIRNHERLINDILERLYPVRHPHAPTKPDSEFDTDAGSDDADNGNCGA